MWQRKMPSHDVPTLASGMDGTVATRTDSGPATDEKTSPSAADHRALVSCKHCLCGAFLSMVFVASQFRVSPGLHWWATVVCTACTGSERCCAICTAGVVGGNSSFLALGGHTLRAAFSRNELRVVAVWWRRCRPRPARERFVSVFAICGGPVFAFHSDFRALVARHGVEENGRWASYDLRLSFTLNRFLSVIGQA